MRLTLGTGPAPRLLAPGLPDWIGADGERVGWVVRDVLFWLDQGGVSTVRLPDLADEVAASPTGWTASTALGAVRVNPKDGTFTALLSVDEGEPLAVLPGRDCAVVVAVPEHSLVRLADGACVKLPDAATRAPFLAPFGTGVGLVWIDLDRLYRLTDGGIPNGLGTATGAQAIVCGPEGATLVGFESDTICAAPKRLAVRLGASVDVESARFSPDGLRALVADEDGVLELDLVAGKELRRWNGSFLPVGYAPGPVRWDRAAGTLIDADGAVLASGFAGASPGQGGGWLAGPGGAIWSTETGAKLREGLPPGLVATNGRRVLVADDAEVRILDGATFPHTLCEGGDDALDAARLDDESVTLQTLEGETAAYSLEGAPLWRRSEGDPIATDDETPDGVAFADAGEPSAVYVGSKEWPLPGDGAAMVAGELWVWTTEGSLFALPA